MKIFQIIKQQIIQEKANREILKLAEHKKLIEDGLIGFDLHHIKKLLFECDVNVGNKKVGWPTLRLMFILKNNNMLNPEEMCCLLKKSDLNKVKDFHATNFIHILSLNNNFLSNQQLKKIWDSCSIKHQQKIINYFFLSNFITNKEKIIDFLLNDCQIIINKKVINHLNNNEEYQILEKIKIRDLHNELEKNVKKKEMNKKINIKI